MLPATAGCDTAVFATGCVKWPLWASFRLSLRLSSDVSSLIGPLRDRGVGPINGRHAAMRQLLDQFPAEVGAAVPSTHTFPEIRGEPTPREANVSGALGPPSFPYRNR